MSFAKKTQKLEQNNVISCLVRQINIQIFKKAATIYWSKSGATLELHFGSTGIGELVKTDSIMRKENITSGIGLNRCEFIFYHDSDPKYTKKLYTNYLQLKKDKGLP